MNIIQKRSNLSKSRPWIAYCPFWHNTHSEALAFLPDQALPISIGYDLGATLLTWSIGPILLGGLGTAASGSAVRRLLSSLSSSPHRRRIPCHHISILASPHPRSKRMLQMTVAGNEAMYPPHFFQSPRGAEAGIGFI